MNPKEMIWDMHLSVYQSLIPTSERLLRSPLVPKSTRKNLFNPNRRLEKYQERSAQRQDLVVKDPAIKEAPQLRQVSRPAEPYPYKPLKDHEFRLLHIQPATSQSEEVHCTLTPYSLDDASCPAFEALSYTWGDPTEEHGVLCDGKFIRVTRNLLAALGDIRLADRPRTFWIDAICINQGDIEERMVQVQHMNFIYQKATSVVVWLSEPSLDSAAGFKLVHQLNRVAGNTPPEQWDQPIFDAELKDCGLPPSDSPDWTALESLYWQPWFGRVWIIQEITFAKAAVIVCGTDSMPWDMFAYVTTFLYRRNFRGLTSMDINPGLNLLKVRADYQAGAQLQLLVLLTTFRRSLATNPIDQVYALLNLAPDTDLRPDYSLTAPHVFRTLTTQFLKDSLYVLNLNSDPNWKMLEDELPSWVPDWSSVSREFPLLFAKQAQNWHAGGSRPPAIRFSDDGMKLSVKGAAVDEVRDVSESMLTAAALEMERAYAPYMGQRQVADTLEFSRERRWRLWERLVLKLKKYPTGEDIRAVLHSTLVGGEDVAAEVPGGPSLGELYEAFRRRETGDKQAGPDGQPVDAAEEDLKAFRYRRAAISVCHGRKIFTTKRGYVGLGPHSILPGDQVVLFQGGKTAYVVKKVKKTGEFKFLGEAYLHGFMNGEGAKDDQEMTEEFTLV